MGSELYDRLDDLKPDDNEDTDAFLARLEADARQGNTSATLFRVRLGMALAEEEPPKGEERGQWQEERAEALGIKPRQLRNYIAAGRALADFRERHPRLASRMPIEVLNKPLSSIPQAVEGYERHKNINWRPKRERAPLDTRLKARLDKIVEDSARLKDGRWRFLKDAKDELTAAYRKAARPTAESLVDEQGRPTALVANYMGSKQSSYSEIVAALARIVPPTGPFGSLLVEPFTGLGAVSRYLLELGVVDYVRLNDASLPMAALMTAIIADPDALVDNIRLRLPGDKKPRQKLLDEAWEVYLEEVEQAPPTGQEQVQMAMTWEPPTHDEDLAWRAALLLGSRRGDGFKNPPNEKLAQQWNTEKVCRQIHAWHEIFKDGVIGNRCTWQTSWDVLREPPMGTLFVDPPYWGTEHYYGPPFTKRHHEDLQNELSKQGRRPWLLTYGEHRAIRDLYGGEVDGEPLFNIQPLVTQSGLEELWITPASISDWCQPQFMDAPVQY